MALREEFRKSGEWLFRWRSYLPLLLIVLFLLACAGLRHPQGSLAAGGWWEIFCLAVSFAGLGVRLFTGGYVPAGTSGRNVKGQVADVLNTTGVYSLVRHPLYLGNFLIWLGISLFWGLWWFSLIIVLILWLYYERIMFAEEEFLREKFGDDFTVWADQTPAFIPKWGHWRKPSLPFSIKTAIRKEYSAFFAIVVVFTLLKLAEEFWRRGILGLGWQWVLLFSVSLIIYLGVRFLKKRTDWLNVTGR
ncbi:MAG: methyltransferase family protein [Thermodesulfobacteriota bacterium]